MGAAWGTRRLDVQATTPDANELLHALLEQAIMEVIAAHCTREERLRVRLALEMASPETEAVWENAATGVAVALADGVNAVLNHIVPPTGDAEA